MCFFSSSAIKPIQVLDCCVCRWFREASIFVSSAIMQTFHTGTPWAEEAHERGSSLNQIKACVLTRVWEPAPRRGCGGNEIIHSPLVTPSAFLYITVIEIKLLRSEKWNSNVTCNVNLCHTVWTRILREFVKTWSHFNTEVILLSQTAEF